jgi:hypothetical protein
MSLSSLIKGKRCWAVVSAGACGIVCTSMKRGSRKRIPCPAFNRASGSNSECPAWGHFSHFATLPACPNLLPSRRKSRRQVFRARNESLAMSVISLIASGAQTCARSLERVQQKCLYSITSSARASTVGGRVRPSALAVLRLIVSSKRSGCWTGSSPGFVPCRILSTYPAARRNSSR